MTEVVIMSGPPGSGKSYQAAKLAERFTADGDNGVVVSADHYFCGHRVDYLGIPLDHLDDPSVLKDFENYQFEPGPEPIAAAHAQCGRAFLYSLEREVDVVIVDNTNIWIGEKAPYYAAAQWFNAEVSIVRVEAPLHLCLERNTHEVPRDIVEMMHHVHNARNDRGFLRETLPWWAVTRANG